MWIVVALRATGEFFTMNKSMASLTFWHYVVPVLFSRVVCVVFDVAIYTIKLVFPAFTFNLGEYREMATSTFVWRERFDLHFIR
jgi:hypothetical protein